ncbi:hypothetical protein [Streptantibioticus cattleyicolor]|uniref:Uncharacterized protein n=1 Tax=Streptantibioticus cattleyicolor (strain ATCC 35852 / DSM 46488 / JCM 4925 / NBRC 14057 / NRRL 8057) TaxID=1003195 RepID=F8JLK9_STREN|nr:hypothetical protein [Streptantibioticus cattleyicolor]AEW98268.1 hypothetical protein SCATT_p00750 [Streptantibioticus cattleyicolor NRRL 8057 = DSM 46488]CCB72670.1 conserved protein of unknown function [Streptantibioticus cattleyicolor NRRL 8057 = DSM 46488]
MSDGMSWIGEHWYSGAIVKDGMLSDICLTAVRGVDAVDFVVRLGADRREAEHPVLFRDFDRLSVDPGDSVAMFGHSGEWAYVLEVERSTWHLLLLERLGQDTLVGRGEELVCLDRFLHEHPWVCYIDAAGELGSAEPGDSLLETVVPPEDRLGAFAALDAAMRRAGAVRATFPGCEDPEDEDEELARRLFGAVGEHLGLSLPRREIERGLLPAVHLPSPL